MSDSMRLTIVAEWRTDEKGNHVLEDGKGQRHGFCCLNPHDLNRRWQAYYFHKGLAHPVAFVDHDKLDDAKERIRTALEQHYLVESIV